MRALLRLRVNGQSFPDARMTLSLPEYAEEPVRELMELLFLSLKTAGELTALLRISGAETYGKYQLHDVPWFKFAAEQRMR